MAFINRLTLLEVLLVVVAIFSSAGAKKMQPLTGTKPIPSLTGVTNLRTIATKIAPLIYLHSRDPFRPSSVDYFVSNMGHSPSSLRDVEEIRFHADEKLAMNYKDKGWLKGSKNPADWPVYVYISKPVTDWPCAQAGDVVHDIIYWTFYPFNGGKITKQKIRLLLNKIGPSGNHVGDWEQVGLRVLIRNKQVTIIAVQSSRHSGSLAPISTPGESGLQWADDNGKISAQGTHPVYYSSWHGHSLYPYKGCFIYAGQKVDLSTIVQKVLKVSPKIKKVLKKVPIVDAEIFDFALNGPKWPAWKHTEFVGVNGVPVDKHRWWWLKEKWMWGNTKTGGLYYVNLTPFGFINKGLGKLTDHVCKKLELGNILVDVVCGLCEAPKAPFRQLNGIQKKFGSPERCQPLKHYNLLKDHNKDKNVPHQCIDGPEKTHGNKDTSLLTNLKNVAKNGAKKVKNGVKNVKDGAKKVAKKLKFW